MHYTSVWRIFTFAAVFLTSGAKYFKTCLQGTDSVPGRSMWDMRQDFFTIRQFPTLRFSFFFWDVMYCWLVASYRCFGAACRSRNVAKYQSTLRNIPEEHRSHLLSGGNLKSAISSLSPIPKVFIHLPSMFICMYVYIYIYTVTAY
jgi:hypothetical protein